MAGLPFPPLVAPSQDPAVVAGTAAINADIRAGRPWIESKWDTPRTQGADKPPTYDDPLAILAFTSKTAHDLTMKGFEDQQTALQRSIAPDIDAAYAAYGIDFHRIEDSNLDFEAKEERKKDLAATYEKKKLSIQNKIQTSINELTQKRVAAMTALALHEAKMRGNLEGIANEGKRLGWSEEDVHRAQLQELGISVPSESAATRAQTPIQRLRELTPILSAYDREALRYRTNPKTKRPQILAPESEWRGDTATEADWRDISAIDLPDFWRFRRDYLTLTKEAAELRRTVVNRPTPDLVSAARTTLTPLAQTVTQVRSEANSNDLSSLSDAELRRIAGM